MKLIQDESTIFNFIETGWLEVAFIESIIHSFMHGLQKGSWSALGSRSDHSSSEGTKEKGELEVRNL